MKTGRGQNRERQRKEKQFHDVFLFLSIFPFSANFAVLQERENVQSYDLYTLGPLPRLWSNYDKGKKKKEFHDVLLFLSIFPTLQYYKRRGMYKAMTYITPVAMELLMQQLIHSLLTVANCFP